MIFWSTLDAMFTKELCRRVCVPAICWSLNWGLGFRVEGLEKKIMASTGKAVFQIPKGGELNFHVRP